MMKASVILSTYNGERFILEQLESIRLQTLPVFEVIISDDCSNDDTVKIISSYIEKYELSSSWKIVQNKVNKGYEKNFLDGCNLATGDILFFCDQDDIWTHDRVEKILSIYEHHSKIQVLGTSLDVFYYDKDTRKWSDSELAHYSNNDGELILYEDVFFNSNHKRSGCTMSVRRAYFEQVCSFWQPGWAHDDFFWKMGLLSKQYANYHYISMRRRMHANNTTVIRIRTREGRVRQIKSLKLQAKSLLAYSDIVQCDIEMKTYIKRFALAADLRESVLVNRDILSWLRLLICYRDCYPSNKALLLDLYLTVFDKYRGK